jgi:hypothetical protein
MAPIDSVRPSRDGDQFHHYWAARQCLRLLLPTTDLIAISIEGPAVADGEQAEDGVDSIDVAEYRGSTDPRTATHIRYVQLKHSSRRTEQEWIASDLTGTLRNFAARYLKFVTEYGRNDVAQRFSFAFITNRPLAASLMTGIDDLRADKQSARARAAAHAMGLEQQDAVDFARVLTLSGRSDDFLEQRSLLHRDVSGYLPEGDRDASLKMKHMVERRATTEFKHRPEINRLDVLDALGARDADLYPAKVLIELPPTIVPRKQLRSLADAIASGGSLSIIRADGGVGKSVLSMQLGEFFPTGSQTFVYDCFGNGGYRSASGYRHRCRDGLVQLANEMAGCGLADPLVPSGKAEPSAYMRAFKARAKQAADKVASEAPNALLCIIIDAADSAQIAADEAHDGSSFARLLLRETWPENVRIVLTSRPHRVKYLDPPQTIPRLDLDAFDIPETTQHLRTVFSEASAGEVLEFHRQTSRNPRVQANALVQPTTLNEVLRGLAGEPRTVDDLIGDLLQSAIDRVMSDAPQTERAEIDTVCASLATLRPFVPLEIVARVANVPIAMVRSLAHDLQRPLIVREDAIQFRDEPTETWFRKRFRPTGDQLDAFIARLVPAAAASAYVAAGLPQLLLEAGRFDDLVRLALTDEALPDEPAMARRDVALQRLTFALKAAIREGRYLDAAKLALKTGGETAADARQQMLISANTDLAALFLEPEQMLEQVSRRLIAGGKWTGSEHAYEAAFLSGHGDLAGDAASRLRLANEWLRQWATRPRSPREGQQSVSSADIAEMAFAELNLSGAYGCARSLRRWRARERSFKAGCILASRMLDSGRYQELDELAHAAGNDLGLLLAITNELAKIGRVPPKPAVARMTRLVTSRHVRIEPPSGHYENHLVLLAAITDTVTAAQHYHLAPKRLLARTLTRYMPAMAPILEGSSATYRNSRAIYLSAYCLRASLRNESVTADKLKTLRWGPPRVRDRKSSNRQSREKIGQQRRRPSPDLGELREFEEEMAVLLPWHVLAAEIRVGRVKPEQLAKLAENAASASKGGIRHIYDGTRMPLEEIAMLRGTIAICAQEQQTELIAAFEEWRLGLKRSLYTPTLIALARRAGRTTGGSRICLQLGHAAYSLMAGERQEASGIAEVFVDVARAVLVTSKDEAREYFEQAIEVSGKIGEENLHRWKALCDLAMRSGSEGSDRPELAYRFSRIAELVKAYSDRFDWDETITSLVAISPPSGPVILSRWIDRRALSQFDGVRSLIAALRDRGALEARNALCMLPFHGLSDPITCLHDALNETRSRDARERIAAQFLRFTRHSGFRADDWRRVANQLGQASISPSEALEFALRAEREAAAREAPSERKAPAAKHPRDKREERDWKAVFADLDATDAGDLSEAYKRFRSGEPPWSIECFFKEAFRRLPPGRESAFIKALGAAGFASLYDARQLISVLPEAWRSSLAVRRAMLHFLKALARLECTSITTNGYYPSLPWEILPEFGLSRDDIYREAVAAMGEVSHATTYSNMFDLAGLLSSMITPMEAAEALGYGLSLMEPLLMDGDDGPWRAELSPPNDANEALAGFVWSALASPWAERRWQGAHAVRAFCAIDSAVPLDTIARLAAAGEANAYGAPGLVFYGLHARLWLTIALSRTAEESPATTAKFLPFIQSHATRSNPHVLIRDFAAKALLECYQQGVISLDLGQVSELEAINLSQLPLEPRSKRAKSSSNMWSVGSGFLFRHDFGQYWANPLAQLFHITQDDVQKSGATVIHDIWGAEEDGDPNRDLRLTNHQFDRVREYRLQSSWPAVDELAFYQSAHALMIVAGRLLEAFALMEDEWERDPFNAWLDNYRTSLENGLWLADRRDDKPEGLWLEPPPEGIEELLDQCFTDLLIDHEGRFAAAANWEVHRGSLCQNVVIDSVLVSPDRSSDLARALQNAQDHDDYRLPSADDQFEAVEKADWFLRGWIRRPDRERRLDRHDVWAGGLRAAVPVPGADAHEVLELTEDRPSRTWAEPDGQQVLRAEVWSDGEQHDDEALHDHGMRLMAKRSTLDKLMERTDKHLLFEVSFRVDRRETRYTKYMTKEEFDAVNLKRYLVLRPGSGPLIAPRLDRTRKRARRAAQS